MGSSPITLSSTIAAIDPGFAAPVRAVATTRAGGISLPPFDQLNLGAASGDDLFAVSANRQRLAQLLPNEPLWLQQVHSNQVIHLDDWKFGVQADAAWTDRPNQIAVVLTADCLPILIADQAGGCVAAVHAGWRGLAGGVIENTLEAIRPRAGSLRAWIGPSIRQPSYEVGQEVKAAFSDHSDAFSENPRGRWQADLQAIAVEKLRHSGVEQVDDSGLCTFAEADRFYSHRRSAPCGRQASLIWVV